MWSALALLTVRTAPAPPLLLNALCFGTAGIGGLAWIAGTGRLGRLRSVPLGAYAFGTAGLFAYHLTYFSALRLAPAAEAGLIAYLWPLFIVLLSGLLPSERIRAAHVAGAGLAFAGVAILLLGRGGGIDGGHVAGLALAFLCAVIWAVYSVGSRLLGAVPTEGVVVCCLATAALSIVAHMAFEVTAWPLGLGGWTATALLGLGPVGLAFITWDVGMKRGDIQLLGVLAYAAPLLSTLILVAAGEARATASLALASVLVVGGAGLAAMGSRAPPRISAPKGG